MSIFIINLIYNANLEGSSLKVLFSLAFNSTLSGGVGQVFPLFDGPEVLDELPVDCGILDVELGLEEIFELGVLLHGLDHVGASPEEDAHNVEGGLVAVDAEDAEGVLAQLVIHALQETVQEVVGHMEDDTLTFDLLVFDKVEGEGCIVPA